MQARNFTTNVPKILDLKSSSEQIFPRKLSLGAPEPDGRDQGFQATIMKSSVDEVREKGIAFLQGNFDNVRFSENYCFTVHKGDAESLTDLIDRYSLNST